MKVSLPPNINPAIALARLPCLAGPMGQLPMLNRPVVESGSTINRLVNDHIVLHHMPQLYIYDINKYLE